jgi:hypothetical protein
MRGPLMDVYAYMCVLSTLHARVPPAIASVGLGLVVVLLDWSRAAAAAAAAWWSLPARAHWCTLVVLDYWRYFD